MTLIWLSMRCIMSIAFIYISVSDLFVFNLICSYSSVLSTFVSINFRMSSSYRSEFWESFLRFTWTDTRWFESTLTSSSSSPLSRAFTGETPGLCSESFLWLSWCSSLKELLRYLFLIFFASCLPWLRAARRTAANISLRMFCFSMTIVILI